MPYFATNLVVEYFVENRGKYCVEIFCDNLLQKFPHIARNYIVSNTATKLLQIVFTKNTVTMLRGTIYFAAKCWW